MTNTKDNGGFFAGLMHLIGILLFLSLLYGLIKWVITCSVKEKIMIVVGIFLMYLYILWGQSLM